MENDAPYDPLPEMIAEVDQWVCNAPMLGKAMYAEWKALVDEGMGTMTAAVVVGTRYKLGG